jgi:hypothetical protein
MDCKEKKFWEENFLGKELSVQENCHDNSKYTLTFTGWDESEYPVFNLSVTQLCEKTIFKTPLLEMSIWRFEDRWEVLIYREINIRGKDFETLGGDFGNDPRFPSFEGYNGKIYPYQIAFLARGIKKLKNICEPKLK